MAKIVWHRCNWHASPSLTVQSPVQYWICREKKLRKNLITRHNSTAGNRELSWNPKPAPPAARGEASKATKKWGPKTKPKKEGSWWPTAGAMARPTAQPTGRQKSQRGNRKGGRENGTKGRHYPSWVTERKEGPKQDPATQKPSAQQER